MGILMACPHYDLTPLMAWMEECKREKVDNNVSSVGYTLL